MVGYARPSRCTRETWECGFRQGLIQNPDYVADVTREMEKTVDEIVELQIDEQSLAVDNVKAYLQDIYARLPTTPPDELPSLLPDRWIAEHPQHLIQGSTEELVGELERRAAA